MKKVIFESPDVDEKLEDPNSNNTDYRCLIYQNANYQKLCNVASVA